MIEGGLSTPRDIEAGVPQDSFLFPILYNLYIIDTPQIPGVYLALFADYTYTHTHTHTHTQQIAKRVMFSENFSAVSSKRNRGVSAGT
jgi:hypothetical protein